MLNTTQFNIQFLTKIFVELTYLLWFFPFFKNYRGFYD